MAPPWKMLWHILSMKQFKKKGLQKQTSFCPGFFGDGTWHESNGDRPDTVLRFSPRGGHRQRLLLIKATFSWSWPLPIMMTMWICLRPGWSMMFSTDCVYTEFRAYRSNETLFFRFSNEVPVFFYVFVHTFSLHGWAGTLTMAKSLWRECWSMMPSLLSTDIEVIYLNHGNGIQGCALMCKVVVSGNGQVRNQFAMIWSKLHLLHSFACRGQKVQI